jgi:hypothetical protein
MDINEILEDIIAGKSGCGTISGDCGCGRTNYVQCSDNYEDGEYEELEKRAHEKPDGYYCHRDCDNITMREFNGKTWVIGCSCNWHHRYALFLWHDREIIVNFLKECRKQKVEEALEIDQLMSDSKLLD